MKRIIFKREDNSIGIVIPTSEALEKYGIEAIAKKDVPYGLEYKIVDTTDVPKDRTFRDAWEWGYETSDGVGDEFHMFEDDPQHPNNKGKNNDKNKSR